MLCLKGRISIELPEITRYSSDLSLLFAYFLSPFRFVATTNRLNRSMFSIPVSDVDSKFSLGLKTVKQKERMMNGGWSSR